MAQKHLLVTEIEIPIEPSQVPLDLVVERIIRSNQRFDWQILQDVSIRLDQRILECSRREFATQSHFARTTRRWQPQSRLPRQLLQKLNVIERCPVHKRGEYGAARTDSPPPPPLRGSSSRTNRERPLVSPHRAKPRSRARMQDRSLSPCVTRLAARACAFRGLPTQSSPRGCALNRTDALDVLRSSRFEAFVGVTESAELDFKGEPYQLEDERGKLELAKDVAALANAGGGIIVIGVRTTLPETSRVEVARDIRLIPVSVVDLRQCRNLARSRVYPDVGGLDVAFHSSSHDPTRGLLAIDVPPQAATARPFLVHSPLVGDKTVGWLVGLPTRHRDATDHASIEELHRRIRDGDTKPRSSIRDALSRLEAVPEQVVAPSVTAAERADQLVERTFPENAEDDLIDTSMPHLVLVFAPSGGQIRDFLEDGGARKLVAPAHDSFAGHLSHRARTRRDLGWSATSPQRRLATSRTDTRWRTHRGRCAS